MVKNCDRTAEGSIFKPEVTVFYHTDFSALTILMFPSTSSRETSALSGKQN